MWDEVLEALKDSAITLGILLVVYFLIEFLEFNYAEKIKKSKLLNGKASPIFGAIYGCIPQCGFSIVATDLYSKKSLSIGALIAVYIATSDEALPLMISDPSKILYLLLLVGVKIAIGIGAGYLAMLILPRLFKKKEVAKLSIEQKQIYTEKNDEHDHEKPDHKGHEKHEHHDHIGCCGHDLDRHKKFNWKHPLIHSIKIFLIILIVNIIMKIIIFYSGDGLETFLKSSYVFQPLFAVIVGLIPNCAASVVLTELFMLGSLSFGSLVAGLSVNAGLAMLILFKQNKSIKENISIVAFCFLFSLAFGYALHFVPMF